METGRSLKKELGYHLYAFVYRVCCLFPIRQNQVFSIMTHDPSESGNVRRLEHYMAQQQVTPPYRFTALTKKERNQMTQVSRLHTGLRLLTAACSFFCKKPWQMARAEYILMDNSFLPMAYLKIRRETKVVQLWHGTGTIKKFGQDATKGWLHEQERRINQNITHLIVNAPALVEQYARAFGVAQDRTYPTGLPRTDALLEKIRQMQKQTDSQRSNHPFLQQHPELAEKKLLLYAPTFRDSEQANPRLHLDIEELCRQLPEDYTVLLRLHPFVAAAYEKTPKEAGWYLVSDYPDLAELMCLSDALITDYSSIIFDYILLDKPMYFSTDDLEEFSDSGRGFYEPYESFVPGPVIFDPKQLAEQIQRDLDKTCSQKKKLSKKFSEELKSESLKEDWQHRREEFVRRYYEKRDGKAAERIYQLICEKEQKNSL